MKSRSILLSLTLLLSVMLTLFLVSSYTGAANYKGDGAIPNGNGGWAQPPVTTQTTCLECHGSGANHYQCGGFCPDPTNVRDKSSYLMTGHKNMLRKVSPGSPWAGADGTLYGTTDAHYGSGSTYDWIAGTVDWWAQTSLGIFSDMGAKQLFYIWGAWIDPGQLNTALDGGFTGEQNLPGGGNYDCGRCHTTGYRFDASGPEPTTYNGTPITDAQFSRIPSDYTTGTSSWYLTSIQCERCHRDVANEAGGHNCYIGSVYNPTYTSYSSCTGAGGTWTVVKPTFENVTALCIECHRQDYFVDPTTGAETYDTTNQIISLSTDLKVGDGGSCSDGVSPDRPTCLATIGNTWSYAPYFDASMGQAFLSSPHARFTGTLAQTAQNSPDLSVAMTGTYNSAFQDSSTGKNLGCTGCHDPHQSTVEAVGALKPIVKDCTNCHTTSTIKHPRGQGTPIPTGTSADFPKACQICHMFNSYHFFRISVDPNYSTFPTETQFYVAGQTTANTAPDGKLSGAVWMDVDFACGQCHGGGVNGSDANSGATPRSKEYLARAAKGMHGKQDAQPIAAITAPPTITGHTVSFIDNSTDAEDPQYDLLIAVNWGDGTISTGHAGGTFSHTYISSRKFTIRHKATDTVGLSGYESISVVVPRK